MPIEQRLRCSIGPSFCLLIEPSVLRLALMVPTRDSRLRRRPSNNPGLAGLLRLLGRELDYYPTVKKTLGGPPYVQASCFKLQHIIVVFRDVRLCRSGLALLYHLELFERS